MLTLRHARMPCWHVVGSVMLRATLMATEQLSSQRRPWRGRMRLTHALKAVQPPSSSSGGRTGEDGGRTRDGVAEA
ncbi:hypothetical protein BD413DRAFT_566965 [Trametes elegans]|nr:hypothetical protein BD413DRAFT_566965 [Trametes elegans]